MSRTILFVCTANVCRSPMAAALFGARARRAGEADAFQAVSAGTWAVEGQPASGHAITVLARRGIDLAGHRACEVTRELLSRTDLVMVMTRNHREALTSEFPEAQAKVHLMSELRGSDYDVIDPYGGTLAEYEYCAQELENLIEEGYQKIRCWAYGES